MFFNVVNIAENDLIAIKRLSKAFFNDDVITNNSENYVYIHYIIYQNKVKVIVKNQDYLFEKEQEFIDTVSNDLKYCMLCCFYFLFSKYNQKSLPWGVLTGIRPTKLVHKYFKLGFSNDKILSILTNKYLISEEKANLLLNIVDNQYKNIKDINTLAKSISIYINIPFCLSRCTYCSHTSYSVNYPFISVDEYLNKLMIEIIKTGNYIKENKINITAIYIGGGTPTAIDDNHLEKLLSCIDKNLFNKNILEYTVECGRPDSITQSKLAIIKKYHVTRISINPQTFNNNTLKKVNRNHESIDIINKFNLARKLSFNNINMDLIIGLPNESLNDIKNSIEETIKLNPESITIHTLALKRGADLFNAVNLSDLAANLSDSLNYINNLFSLSDYLPYYLYRQKNIASNLENIGYAKKDFISIYNIIMIEELQNIIGLGCSASSKFLNKEIILNPKDLISYCNSYEEYLNKKLTMLSSCLTKEEDLFDE